MYEKIYTISWVTWQYQNNLAGEETSAQVASEVATIGLTGGQTNESKNESTDKITSPTVDSGTVFVQIVLEYS